LAYMAVKNAEGERKAADLQYEAKLRLAEADAQSAVKRADGERAIKMVDVTVEREKVGVEQARVDVERQSLANKQEFEDAALKFELEKFRIAAEKEIRVAAAQAMGQMLASAKMQIFGDPETMTRMSSQFMRAAGLGVAMDGLMKNLPPGSQEAIASLASSVASQLTPKGGDGAAAEANGGVVGVPGPVDVPAPVAPQVAPEAKSRKS